MMTMNATEVFQQTAQRIAEKLARFERLLRDPDLAPYVAALRNGELPPRPVPAPAPQKPGAPSGIRDAIRSLKGRIPEQFTAEQIDHELQRMNVAVGARNRDKAIRNTMFKLAQRKELKLLKTGSSGKSNTYTWNAKK
jgi:hypothetical protein